MLNMEEMKRLYWDWKSYKKEAAKHKRVKDEAATREKVATGKMNMAIEQIEKALEAEGQKGFELKDGEYVVRFGYRKPTKVVDTPDVDAIPDEFVKVERKPDKTAIKKFLEQNGGCNWASLKDGVSNLNYSIDES